MKKSISSLILAVILSACTALPLPSAGRTGTQMPSPSAAPSPSPPAATPAPTPAASPAASPVAAPTAAEGTGWREMAALMPGKQGYQWQYFGFAEYAMTMKLKTVETQSNARVYTAEGAVADMSGGESKNDFSVRVRYTAAPGVLRQELAGAMAMDRTLPVLELIRAPLSKGTQWTQAVRDSTGRAVRLACTITDVKQVNGRAVYFVYYKSEGSDYYEKREITEGIGVTAYDKLFMYDSGQEEIGYRLNLPGIRAEMTGWDTWLPRLDYEYTYFGLAEYGHKGTLSKVSSGDTEFIYDFNGHYDDATGDSSRFKVRYRVDLVRGTITEQVLSNERGKPEVNSRLHNLVILKFPLALGNRWHQKAKLDGRDVNVEAKIIEYNENNGLVKVKYTAKEAAEYFENTYMEIRTFEKGFGMTGFGNLLPGSIGISEEEAKYADKLQEAINQHMFGYSMNKSLIQ